MCYDLLNKAMQVSTGLSLMILLCVSSPAPALDAGHTHRGLAQTTTAPTSAPATGLTEDARLEGLGIGDSCFHQGDGGDWCRSTDRPGHLTDCEVYETVLVQESGENNVPAVT